MRFTLVNMGTEMGAVTSYIQPDARTKAWVDKRTSKPYQVFETDPGFEYDSVQEIDISQIEPQIAVPHAPDDVKPVAQVAGRHIDQAYLGSCASGRLEDLAIAAAVLKGRKVHPDVRFIVAGTNFGCGSSTPAHYSILALGITAVVASSFGKLFMSNCVSGGLWPIACPDIVDFVETGQVIEIDTDTAEIRNLDTGKMTRGHALPGLFRDMAAAGGEKDYLKARLARS